MAGGKAKLKLMPTKVPATLPAISEKSISEIHDLDDEPRRGSQDAA